MDRQSCADRPITIARQGGDPGWKRELTKRALFHALDALDAHWNNASGVAPVIAARTKDGAQFVASVSRSKDIAALRRTGLA